MEQYTLFTEKQEHFTIVRDILLKYGLTKLTRGNKLEIVDLAYNMNLNGKRRKLTKQVYIKECIR
jgi:hypothetical protein